MSVSPRSKIAKVLTRGNRHGARGRLLACAGTSGPTPKDVDLLVTNQPNRLFLRNWT